MRSNVYFAGRNAHRYISLSMPKSVFFADTGIAAPRLRCSIQCHGWWNYGVFRAT